METRTIVVLLALLLAAFGMSAKGVELYQGEVVVEDQSPETRRNALSRALAQVLVKTTGNPAAPEAPGVAEHLSRAPQYVQQFQYRTEERPRPGEEPAERVLLLSARFDPAAVERILRDAGLALWGQERPTVLIWLVLQTEEGRQLVGAERPVIQAAIHRAARERGLPVLMPLLDLADQQAVSERELWGGFTESLVAASERYGTRTFLLGRVSSTGDGWRGRWTLFNQGRERYFEAGSDDLAGVLEAGIGSAADALGDRYAVSLAERSGSRVRIAVEGVTSLADYDRVLDYLGGLTLVQQVDLDRVHGRTMSLRLAVNAGIDRLDQTIQLGEVLEPAPASVAAEPGGPAYHRRYLLRQ